jgi:RNA polymerase sigma factor (sigma-70 family)
MASAHQGAVRHYLHRLFDAGSVTGLGEGQLLERFVARRDVAAFEALVARHGPMVLAVCRRILRDEHDAEDAFQATFLVLVRRAASIQRRDLLANWLYGVAHRVAVRARQQSSRRRTFEKDGLDVEPPDASKQSFDTDECERLLDELRRLPKHYRTVVVLCHLEGLTHEEAADQLRCPVGTVRSRLARARELLRNRLRRRGLGISVAAVGSMLAAQRAPAAVTAGLIDSTVKIASQVAAGQAMAGVVSASVLTLTEGVLRTMFFHKLKLVATVGLAVGCVATGAGVLAFQESGGPDRGTGAGRPRAAQVAQDEAAKRPPSRTAGYDPLGPSADDANEQAMLQEEARDELELLKLRLAAKQAELAAEQSQISSLENSVARLKTMHDSGQVSIGEVDVASATLLNQKARSMVKRVEVKELETRVAQAERRLKHPEWLRVRANRGAPVAPSGDLERRVRALEQRVDELSDELAGLKRK